MNLRPRTVRRLMVLLAAMLVLVGTGAALYWRNEHVKATRLATARQAGMAAYKAGDYQAALDSLKIYVARVRTDPEALYAYGVSRTRIEEPNRKHIAEGITVFTTLLQIDPNNLDAKHQLLDLYTQTSYSEESVELADRILRDKPDDVEALRDKCTALKRMRKFEAALAVSEKINELDPADLDQQGVTYALMTELKRTPAQMVERAQKMVAAHPADPRFELLLAWLYWGTGEPAKANTLLRQAATRPAPDATFIRHMVRELDRHRLFKDSQNLLDRAVAQKPDPQVMRILVQRLWQNNRHAQVIERLKDLDPSSPASDTALLAYKALALFEQDKVNDARQIVAALAKRSADNDALSWSTALQARFNGLDPKPALAQYQTALARSPDNSVIRLFIGEAYARLGETELAYAAWRRSADLAPSWSRPHLYSARALDAAGRTKEALAEARMALYVAPDQRQAATLWATIQYKALEQGLVEASTERPLLAAVQQIQKELPGEPQTLPVYVNLLARAGRRDDAINAARTAVFDPKRYDQTTVLRLVAASRANKLGLEEELENAGIAGQDSPRLALTRAAELANAGKPSEGLALLESKAKSATTQPVQWQLALLQYKEGIHDPSAAKAWVALGDANANDLNVQSAILKIAASARADRDFISRTIDRVKMLTGPEGQTWKLERARWLIGSDSTKDAAEAVNILTEIVRTSPTMTEARLLLSAAYETVANSAAAIKELQTAANQEPNNTTITLELARLLQEQKRFADARTYLERAATAPELPMESRRRIAGMLATQGDAARGIKVLESAGKELDVPGQLLLAELYRRQNRFADAETIYARLLATPPLTLDAVRAAADFFGSQHKLDQARKILARLPETNPRSGVDDLVRAGFCERYESVASAEKCYRAATASAAGDGGPWRQLAAYYLRIGRYGDARQAADDGLKNLPDDVVLKRIGGISASLTQWIAQDASVRPVLSILAAAATDDRGASEFLTSAQDPTSRPSTDTMLARLTDVAARNSRSLALRSAIVQWHVGRREFDLAGKAASQTMDEFPNDADSARIATIVYRDAKKWDLAAVAAGKWRQRTPDDPLAADWNLADIRLTQGDPSAALKVLAPHVQRITADPQRHSGIMATLLRARVLAGNDADARAALEPLLPNDRTWRSLWLQLAGEDVRGADVASDWLRHVAPLLSPDDAGETLALAQAWYTLGSRARTQEPLDEAARLLEPIVQKPNATSDAILLRGAVADRAGDAKLAEECYRRGLVMRPDDPNAMNNLAYLILLREGDVAEAHKLAMRAVEISPTSSSFYDTLARIQLKKGDRSAAIASFEKALKLEADNLEALVGLAVTMCDAGKRDSAAGLLAQIDSLVKSKPPMSPQLRRELESLRATMKASLN